MRVDFPISNAGISGLRNDDSRAEFSARGAARMSGRARVSCQQENMSPASGETEPTFSEIAAGTLAAASAPERAVITSSAPRTSAPGTAADGARSGAEDASARVQTTSKGEPDAVEQLLLHTPFGTFDAESLNRRLVFDVIGTTPMEVYFMTHAPGEWMHDEASRVEFARLYGDEALETVDHHGTVPKNADPVWVTKPVSGSTDGRA